jgi:uncharacterized membrane protein (Fun14 family)
MKIKTKRQICRSIGIVLIVIGIFFQTLMFLQTNFMNYYVLSFLSLPILSELEFAGWLSIEIIAILMFAFGIFLLTRKQKKEQRLEKYLEKEQRK